MYPRTVPRSTNWLSPQFAGKIAREQYRAPFYFTAVTVRRGTASVDGVRNSVEFTEKNIRTDLDAMQDNEKISEKLGL